MKRVLLLVLLTLILVSSVGWAQDLELKEAKLEGYWLKLEEKADKLFNGLDLSVEVMTGFYEDNEYKGEIKLKVPIYSKAERRKKEKEKQDFLDKGAELIKELKVNLEKIRILREKEIILKTVMLEEGVKSIDAYHDVKEDIAEVKAELEEGLRRVEAMLE